MRVFGAVVMVSAMVVSNAFAAGDMASAPLAAGKPAGLHEAQIETGGVLLVVGVLGAAAAIAAIASTTQGNGHSTTTTGTNH